MEHLPGHARESEDRQVHHHDDQLPEDQRASCLLGRGEHFVQAFTAGQQPAVALLCVGQTADGVLDDHHRTVNDNAEVQRAQAHQVGADFVGEHAGEGEQHRQRNHHRSDQRCTDITQEQKQHRHHQQRTFEEVFLHRGDGFFHQVGAVVNSDRHHAFGQRAVDLLKLFRHRLGHAAAVLADQHEHRAQHHLTAIFGGGAGTQLTTNVDLGHIAHADRCAVRGGDDNVGDVVDRRHLARRADQQLFAAALDIAGADVGVVALQRRDQIVEGQVVSGQALGVWRNLIFLGEAADGIDLGHAWHVAQLRFDDPVLDHPQVGGGVRRTVLFAHTVLGFDGPQENFPKASGNRPHGGFDAVRQLLTGHLQAFVDQLAGEEQVGAVLENHRDLGQTGTRQRSRLLQAR